MPRPPNIEDVIRSARMGKAQLGLFSIEDTRLVGSGVKFLLVKTRDVIAVGITPWQGSTPSSSELRDPEVLAEFKRHASSQMTSLDGMRVIYGIREYPPHIKVGVMRENYRIEGAASPYGHGEDRDQAAAVLASQVMRIARKSFSTWRDFGEAPPA